MSESTAVTNWDDELAKYAVEVVEAEADSRGGSWLSAQGGTFTYQENDIGKSFTTIVAASVHENQYYDMPFNAGKPRSPVCYAFGKVEEGMAPHPDCEAPQAATCAECDKNKWPKEKGKAKECKNVRRLALLPATPDMTAQEISEAEPAWLKVPVMSVKNWSAYTRVLATLEKKPPFAFITRVGVQPDKKSQFVITFEKVLPLATELLSAAMGRAQELQVNLSFPYRRNEETTAEAKQIEDKKKARFK